MTSIIWEISTTGWTLELSIAPCCTVASVAVFARLRRRIEAVAFLDERAVVGEIDDAELTDLSVDAADGTVGRDVDVAVGRRDGDVAAVALHRIAVVVDDAARLRRARNGRCGCSAGRSPSARRNSPGR